MGSRAVGPLATFGRVEIILDTGTDGQMAFAHEELLETLDRLKEDGVVGWWEAHFIPDLDAEPGQEPLYGPSGSS